MVMGGSVHCDDLWAIFYELSSMCIMFSYIFLFHRRGYHVLIIHQQQIWITERCRVGAEMRLVYRKHHVFSKLLPQVINYGSCSTQPAYEESCKNQFGSPNTLFSSKYPDLTPLQLKSIFKFKLKIAN
jgi:hypothetical protein